MNNSKQSFPTRENQKATPKDLISFDNLSPESNRVLSQLTNETKPFNEGFLNLSIEQNKLLKELK